MAEDTTNWAWIEAKYVSGLNPRQIVTLYREQEGFGKPPSHMTIYRRAQAEKWEPDPHGIEAARGTARATGEEIEQGVQVQAVVQLNVIDRHRGDLSAKREVLELVWGHLRREAQKPQLDLSETRLLTQAARAAIASTGELMRLERLAHGLDDPDEQRRRMRQEEIEREATELARAYFDFDSHPLLGEAIVAELLDSVHAVHVSGLPARATSLPDGIGDADADDEEDQEADPGGTAEAWEERADFD